MLGWSLQNYSASSRNSTTGNSKIIFILSLDFANSLKGRWKPGNEKGRWKPGNENDRRFPTEKTLQNDRIISTGTTIQNSRRTQIVGKMQNVRRYPVDRALQNIRSIPNDRILQNKRNFPIDGTLQNVRRFPNDKTLQNVRKFPIDSTLQNIRRFPIDRTLPNNRRFPIDRTLPNDRRFSINRTLQNDRRFPIDRALQNIRGISTPKTIQNDRRIQIEEKKQNDRRVSIDSTFPNDRRMEYNKRFHNARTDVSNGIMQSDKRIYENRLLEHNRRSQNELKNKIDSLMQNENIQIDKREQDGRRMPNARRVKNDRHAQNYIQEQNRRILEEHNQKMVNSRRIQYDKRMWAVTPLSIRRQDRDKPPDNPNLKFNSSEFRINSTVQEEREKGESWSNFWKNMMMNWESLVGYTPPGGHLLTTRACYCIATTYITALQDFKKYYMMRPFYENNVQFEVGYLVAEIISKYQRMLEIFHLATDYFFKHQSKKHAASTYVLYLYTNVLEMGTVISHLCNMLTELEDKYRFIPVQQSGFSDYHLIKVFDDTEKVNLANEVLAYEKKMNSLKKEKLREQRKMRHKSNKDLHIGMKITTVDRRPKFRSWSLVYGWSIEDNW